MGDFTIRIDNPQVPSPDDFKIFVSREYLKGILDHYKLKDGYTLEDVFPELATQETVFISRSELNTKMEYFGVKGDFDINTPYPMLHTEDKTIIGAINEVHDEHDITASTLVEVKANVDKIVVDGNLLPDIIHAEQIIADAIKTEHLVAEVITTEKIKANAITSEKIKAGQILAEHILADQINAGHIQADAITSDKIAADQIKAEHIIAGSITSDKIQANAITSDKIHANAITSDKIEANSIKAGHIEADAINSTHIVAGAIEAEHIKADQINATHIAADQIKAEHISANQINANHIQANAITADKILAGEIKAVHIAADAIEAKHISANAIEAEHISANAINADKIQANAILAKHIQAGQITSEKIFANSITSNHIQANAIKSNHIEAGVVNATHIAAGTITAGSTIIANGAIGSAQIQDLTANKLTAGTIDTAEVRVASKDSSIDIYGNQIMVNDTSDVLNPKNRVTMGQYNKPDGTTDYGLVVRGEDGQTTMIDGSGVHNAGITDGAIDNNKVSQNANIDGKKLDINSVITTINEDGTKTIEGTKIQVGNKTLDVELSEKTQLITEHSSKLESQQAQITANQNSILLKVDNTTYEEFSQDITNKVVGLESGAIISSNTEPSPPSENMLWLDTSLNPSVLKVYKNGSWSIQNDFKNDAEYNAMVGKISKNTSFIEANKDKIQASISQSEATNIVVTELDKVEFDKTVKSVVVYYAMNTSSTTAPTSGWQTTPPTWEDGKFIWSKTTTRLTNGTSTTTTPVCITGAKGQTGNTGATGATGATGSAGKGIKSTTVNYQASSSGTTVPGGTWTTSIPSVAANQFLWTRTTITYTDNTSTHSYSVGKMGATGSKGDKGDKGNTGATGAAGKGVKTTSIVYQSGTSGTTVPSGAWSSSVPNVLPGRFLWTKTTITYTDDTYSSAYSVGKMGEQGPQGNQGNTGATGATGQGVHSITSEYYLSNSKTSQSGGSWTTTPPTWSAGKYMWTRSKIVYKNPTSTVYTTPVCDSSWEAVNEIEVGGRNLVSKDYLARQDSEGTFDDATNTWSLTSRSGVGTTWGAGLKITGDKVLIPYGKNYIVSFEIKVPVACSWSVDVNNYGVKGSWSGNDNDNTHLRRTSDKNIPAQQWTKCWFSFNNSDSRNTDKEDIYDNSNFGIVNNSGANIVFQIRNVQGELGNMPTEWTPCVEDTEKKFTDLKNKYSDISATVEGLGLEVGSIHTANFVKDVMNNNNHFKVGVGSNQTNQEINSKIKEGSICPVIEGNTVVNRYDNNSLDIVTGMTRLEHGFAFANSVAAPNEVIYPQFDSPILKNGVKYTYIAKISRNTFTGSNVLRLVRQETAGEVYYVNGGQTGIIAHTFTANSATATQWGGSKSNFALTKQVVGELFVDYVMILEGDYSSNPPAYFEGMASVGESGSIRLQSRGQNLFDYKELPSVESDMGKVINLNDGSLSIVGKRASDCYVQTDYSVYLDKDTEYIFKARSDKGWGSSGSTVEGYLLLEKSYSYHYFNVLDGRKFKPKYSGRYYLRLDVNAQTEAKIWDIQIKPVSAPLEYASCSTVSREIKVRSSLKKIPSGVCDKFYPRKDGSCYINRNLGTIMVDGSFTLHSAGNGGVSAGRQKTYLAYFDNPLIKSVGESNTNCVSSTLPNERCYHQDIEGVMVANNSHRVWISVDRQKMAAGTDAEFKKYFTKYPMELVFELEDDKKTLEKVEGFSGIKVESFGTILVDEPIDMVTYHTAPLNGMASIESAISSIEMSKSSIEQKVDVNGVIAAINIGVEDDESEIKIMADKLKLDGAVSIGSLSGDLAQIFEHGSDKTQILGGYIKSGSMDLTGHIKAGGGLQITEGFETGARTTFNVMPNGSVYLAGTVESMNFSEGKGWRIDQNGNAIFNQGEFRAKVVLPNAGMSNEGNIRIWAGSNTPSEAPFRVTSDGYIYATEGHFGGTFSGKIEVGNILITDDGKDRGRAVISISDNSQRLVTEIADDQATIGSNLYVKNFLSVDDAHGVKVSNTDFNFNDKVKLLRSDSSIDFNSGAAKIKVSETKLDFIVSDRTQSVDFQFSNPNREAGASVHIAGQLKVDSNVDIGIVTIRKMSDGIDFLFI